MATPNPKPRNVADLKASILNPSLTSTYECHFSPPPLVRQWMNSSNIGGAIDENKLTLSCREAALPGTSLATHTLDNDRTGVTERHVYRRQYDTTASFTFYVDKDYDNLLFFENWIKFIVNETQPNRALTDSYNYRANFPKDYKTNIYIRKFEKDYKGRSIYYIFNNAYPISINQMPLSYDASQILLCTVNFNFTRYLVKDVNVEELEDGDGIDLNNFLGVPVPPYLRPATFPDSPFRIIQNNFENPIV
tara:strand:+ start:244 stop:990 length:747 start_codon:yes stop_codon:yes gene_type:complete